jgi:hypothetical protein
MPRRALSTGATVHPPTKPNPGVEPSFPDYETGVSPATLNWRIIISLLLQQGFPLTNL